MFVVKKTERHHQTKMCLSCMDPVISAIRDMNPFKAKRSGKVTVKADEVDRDNINVPFILEEKRSVIMPDSVGRTTGSLKVKEETVLTMKKVSSLGLV